MPKPRSPDRDKAKELYLERNGKIPLIDIAKQLSVSEGTVRGWKAKDNWNEALNGTIQTNGTEQSAKNKGRSKQANKKSNTENLKKSALKNNGENIGGIAEITNTKTRGGQPGNKNAVGNKGGPGGPKDNKHAVVTHEFENILLTDDTLLVEERALLEAHYDRFEQQLVIIKTLRIQEQRAMRDIITLRNTPGGMVVESVTKNKGTTDTAYTNRNKSKETWEGNSTAESIDTTTHVAQPVQLRILRIEDGLLRIRGKLQRAIEVWHKMEMDAANLGMEYRKLQLYEMRMLGVIDIDDLVDGDDLGLDPEE